jgi:hypothetical protein
MSESVAKRRPMIDLDEFERRLRQPHAASKPAEDDPLAELARLVGGQGDPYKAMFGAQRPLRPAARASDPGAEIDEPSRIPSDTIAPIEDSVRGVPTLTDGALLREERGMDDEVGANPAADHWAEDEFSSTSFPPDFTDEEPRSRRPLYLMAAIIIVGMGLIGASFALKGARTGPQEVATISAPDGPAKVAVETTGPSSATRSEATVLERGPQGQRVGLVDTREQPVDLSQVPERTPRIIPIEGSRAETARHGSGAAQVPIPAPPPQVQSAHGSDAQPGITALIEPRKVKTVSVRPDGTLVPNSPAPKAIDVPTPTRRPSAAPTPTAKIATPKIAERAVTTPKPVGTQQAALPAEQGLPAPKSTETAPTPIPAKGTYAVQLAAPESEQEARAIQVKVMKKLGSELTGFHTSIRKAAVGDKTVYRVRVGDLSREEAVALCQRMQSGGTDCFVAKN